MSWPEETDDPQCGKCRAAKLHRLALFALVIAAIWTGIILTRL